jgi:hypothetical protein
MVELYHHFSIPLHGVVNNEGQVYLNTVLSKMPLNFRLHFRFAYSAVVMKLLFYSQTVRRHVNELGTGDLHISSDTSITDKAILGACNI